jgi:hypothetical protein
VFRLKTQHLLLEVTVVCELGMNERLVNKEPPKLLMKKKAESLLSSV